MHGLREGFALHEHEIINGIAVEATRWPAPEGVFRDEIVVSGDQEVVAGQTTINNFSDTHEASLVAARTITHYDLVADGAKGLAI